MVCRNVHSLALFLSSLKVSRNSIGFIRKILIAIDPFISPFQPVQKKPGISAGLPFQCP
jgi:hypothetical protein